MAVMIQTLKYKFERFGLTERQCQADVIYVCLCVLVCICVCGYYLGLVIVDSVFCFCLWGKICSLFSDLLVIAMMSLRGVSLHKDQLLQDQLTFKQKHSYELFWFSSLYLQFLFHCFSCLSSSWSSHHNCLNTLYSPVAWYANCSAESAVKHQTDKQTNKLWCNSGLKHNSSLL